MQDYGLTVAQRQYDSAEPPRYNRKPVHNCNICGGEIYPGEQFFRCDECAVYCMDCIWRYSEIAEEDEDE